MNNFLTHDSAKQQAKFEHSSKCESRKRQVQKRENNSK